MHNIKLRKKYIIYFFPLYYYHLIITKPCSIRTFLFIINLKKKTYDYFPLHITHEFNYLQSVFVFVFKCET